MVTYYGKGRKPYQTNQRLGGGGEGQVFDISGMPNMVAKIYKQLATPQDVQNLQIKEKKLLIMIGSPPPRGTSMAWPEDVLYDSFGAFVGYVMPKVSNSVDINEVYEYGNSSKYPDMPYEYKIIMCINMCEVLASVHMAGHVVGDFNPDNIKVNPSNGTITFVDTDSYHISDGANTYRCPVATEDYVSKEVALKRQAGNLSVAPLPTFTKESDNFALAIHIFRMLMNGCHPFAACTTSYRSSVSAPSPPGGIMKGETPFINSSNSMFTIPKYAPEFSSLPPYIQDLFKRAFVDGTNNPRKRPEPTEWRQALVKFRSELKACSNVPFHQYYKKLSACPLCAADMRMSNMMVQGATGGQINFGSQYTPKVTQAPPIQQSPYNHQTINQQSPVQKTPLGSNLSGKSSYRTRNQARLGSIFSILMYCLFLVFVAIATSKYLDMNSGSEDGVIFVFVFIFIPTAIALLLIIFGKYFAIYVTSLGILYHGAFVFGMIMSEPHTIDGWFDFVFLACVCSIVGILFDPRMS